MKEMMWPLVKLDSIAIRGSGHTPSQRHPEYWDGGVKWVSLADSSALDKRYIYDTAKKISALGLRHSSAVLHPKGSVIVSRDAGVGKSAILGEDMAVSQHFIAWQCDEKRLHAEYLYQWLQSHKQEFERIAVGSTVKTIGLGYFKKMRLPLPPISAQVKTAEIFATWDAAIEKTERLIAAKEKCKAGLMAELLTGHRRVGEFKTAWRSWHLGELFEERTETNRGDLPLLSIAREEGVVPRGDMARKDSSNEDKTKYLRICSGDIGYNTMRMWQGVSALSRYDGIVSPAYTVCIPGSKIDGKFASYLFKLPEVINLFYRHSQGLTSDTWNLKFHHFVKIKVRIPEVVEQVAIARVLALVDEELAILQKQRKMLIQQKRGLMQKLLTGQWRMKASEPEALQP